MVYLITYDLNKSGQNYQVLYDLLEKYDYIRDPGLDSVWFISTTKTAEKLAEHIQNVLDENDRIFVTKLNSFEYNGWMHEDIWKWIKIKL
jgi:CRISPR/Cas system-associated endoribonuclease Cas2